MLTFSLSIAFDKSAGTGFQLHGGMHTKQSLTSALLHFIAVACAACLQCSTISNLSFPVAIVHSYSYLSAQFSLPHTLHLPVHPFGSLLSLRSHLPIMLYSSASLFSPLSPAVKIQRANPGTCGIPTPSPPPPSPHPSRNDVYQSDSIRAALSACTLLIPSVFAALSPREAALQIRRSELCSQRRAAEHRE